MSILAFCDFYFIIIMRNETFKKIYKDMRKSGVGVRLKERADPFIFSEQKEKSKVGEETEISI